LTTISPIYTTVAPILGTSALLADETRSQPSLAIERQHSSASRSEKARSHPQPSPWALSSRFR
jgi:hypothetical protein